MGYYVWKTNQFFGCFWCFCTTTSVKLFESLRGNPSTLVMLVNLYTLRMRKIFFHTYENVTGILVYKFTLILKKFTFEGCTVEGHKNAWTIMLMKIVNGTNDHHFIFQLTIFYSNDSLIDQKSPLLLSIQRLCFSFLSKILYWLLQKIFFLNFFN